MLVKAPSVREFWKLPRAGTVCRPVLPDSPIKTSFVKLAGNSDPYVLSNLWISHNVRTKFANKWNWHKLVNLIWGKNFLNVHEMNVNPIRGFRPRRAGYPELQLQKRSNLKLLRCNGGAFSPRIRRTDIEKPKFEMIQSHLRPRVSGEADSTRSAPVSSV